MSLIDDIKRDRDAGTPGPWIQNLGMLTKYDGDTTKPIEVAGLGMAHFSAGSLSFCHQIANSRRIARVPDMEAALLAAENLANAVSVLSGAACLDDDGPSDWENMRSALVAYREATKQA
jgi:hypothetical protein